MPIHYKDIKTESQWRSSTGLTEAHFVELSGIFGAVYENFFGASLSARREKNAKESFFQTYEELFFLDCIA